MTFAGSISARGGSKAGNGGGVETSGKGALGVGATARVDTSAPGGTAGSWLLASRDIVIQGGAGTTPIPGGDLRVDPAAIGTARSNVTLQAQSDLFVNSAIAMTTAGASLDLKPGHAVAVGADIATTGGKIDLAGPVELAGTKASTPTAVTIDSTDAGAAREGADIVFAGSVDGSFSGRQSLTLAAGTAGDIVFKGAVGGTSALSRLKATGRTILLPSVTTTGVQSYNGPAPLGPDTALRTSGGAVLFNSSVTLGASGTPRRW
jgi:hypothetical protein